MIAEDIELTEDVKIKIKEKMINDLVYKNILTEISIKCAEMTKIQTEEEINYLTKNNINKNDIMEVLIWK